MTTLLSFTVVGIVVGCGYAIASLGLVVTYTTSGIFNFAHGAVGMLMAFAYWDLHVNQGWPAWLALIAVLFVLAPLTGAIIERVLMRPLHGSSTGTPLVVTLGLMLVLIGVAYTRWDPSQARVIPEFFGSNHVRFFGVNVSYHRLTVMALAAAVAVGLRLFLYRTRTGIAMRAVVDDPELTALNGASPARIAQLSWALGSSLAALAGILLAPVVYLDVITLTLLVVNAYAAAIVGRMKSLPLTFAGAIILGLLESYFVGYVSGKYSWLGWLNKLGVPTIFFFIILLTMPEVRLRAGRLVGGRAPRVPGLRESVIAGVGFVGLAWFLSGIFSQNTLSHVGSGLALALIMLSLVLLTGYGGQVSLCQLTFVGLGSFVMGRWFSDGSPFGLLVAAGVAGMVGVFISLPALRLTGLYLALATLAFARAMDLMFFPRADVFGFGGRLRVSRLHLLGMTFQSDRSYIILMAVVFAAGGIGVLALRRGPYGRRLAALSDSPAACATLGMNQVWTKASVFAISAAMAGMAGALFGGYQHAVSQNDFLMLQSLALLLAAYIGGINTVTGALLGGIALAMFPVIQAHVPSIRQLQYFGTGLAAISLARNPNGMAGSVAPVLDMLRARRSTREAEAELPVRSEVDVAGITS